MQKETPGQRKLQPRIIVAFLLFLWLVVEVTAWGGLFFLERKRQLRYDPVAVELRPKQKVSVEHLLAGETAMMRYDQQLGWTVTEGYTEPGRSVSAQGLRRDHRVPAVTASGKTRVATFGDSFTFGDDVSTMYTFQERLQLLAPDVEFLNYGVPGFGLDQAYLRYLEEGDALRPDIVLIGFMTENIHRVVNVFRPFYFNRTGLPMTKPRFVPAADGLELIPNPFAELEDYRALLDRPAPTLRRLGERDYYFNSKLRAGPFDFLPTGRLVKMVRGLRSAAEPTIVRERYNPESEAFIVTTRLFDAFYQAVVADGAQPVIVIFPSATDLNRARRGRGQTYQPLLEHSSDRGYLLIDLLPAFDAANTEAIPAEAIPAEAIPVNELANPHYTPPGHKIVADYLLVELRRLGLLAPAFADRDPPLPAVELERLHEEVVLMLRRSSSFKVLRPAEKRALRAEMEAAFP